MLQRTCWQKQMIPFRQAARLLLAFSWLLVRSGATAEEIKSTEVVRTVHLEEVTIGNYSFLKGQETALTAQPFFKLPNFISNEIVSSARKATDELVFDDHNDEADWLPAYEIYIMEKEAEVPGVAPRALHEAVHALNEKVLPFVKQAYNCADCVSCTAFVRRYVQSERVRVPAHFDITAFATVILPLSPSGNYSGGFFVQPTAHVDSRRFVPLEAGDVLVHDFSLNHGVEVLKGGRHTLITWISEKASACKSSSTPWHFQRAMQGDAVAQHIIGMMLGTGNGAPLDEVQALEWTLRAAENGLANAQFSAATMYFEGRGTETDFERSFFWFSKAAEQGDASAQLLISKMLSEGIGTPKDLELSQYWFQLGSAQTSLGFTFQGPGSLIAMFQ